mgnify:CR=1 FL=1
MKKIILLIIAVAAFSNCVFAQSAKQYTKKAEEALAAKNYSEAFAHYHFLVNDAGRGSLENYYGAAESARRARVFYLAETYYKKVAEMEDGKKVHPLTDFWLGDVQKRQGNYVAAKSNFQAFLDGGGSANATYAEKARKEINDCDMAFNLKPSFSEERIEHFEAPVNSEVSDFAAVRVGETLYFSSLREGYEWEQKNERGSKWVQQVDDRKGQGSNAGLTHIYTKSIETGEVKLFNEFNEDGKHTAHVAFANDNTRIYYTLCESVNDQELNCKLYYRDMKSDNKWGTKTMLPESINMPNYNTTQPSIGKDSQADKDLLFFASDRPGTIGGMDIWCSYVSDDGTFSDPVNLSTSFGENGLNTTSDEITPFWDAKNQTLYFSSEGHANLGSFDIYKVRKKLGKWGEVQHMGSPINSSYDDIYYSRSDQGSAYFTSNRPGGLCGGSSDSLCLCNDIYMVPMPNLKLEVYTFNSITEQPIDVNEVNLSNLTNPQRDVQENGQFFEWMDEPLGPDNNYTLLGNKRDYRPGEGAFSTMFDFDKDTTIRVNLYLTPNVDLNTTVYDEITGKELTGAKVQLVLLSTMTSTVLNTHPEGDKSRFFDSLEFKNNYMVIGTKDKYLPDTAFVTTIGIDAVPTHLDAVLRLCKGFDPFPPISIYFDNDYPNPDCMDTYTTPSDLTYTSTFNDYIARRSYYEGKFAYDSKGFNEIKTFFDNDVIGGHEKLDRFAEQLYDYFVVLSDPNTLAEVTILGHASLRSNPTYNLALTKRRVASLRNYLKAWTKGDKSLAPYYNRISVVEAPRGDQEACRGCYEKPSITNVQACRDRRVDIINVKLKSLCAKKTPGSTTY